MDIKKLIIAMDDVLIDYAIADIKQMLKMVERDVYLHNESYQDKVIYFLDYQDKHHNDYTITYERFSEEYDDGENPVRFFKRWVVTILQKKDCTDLYEDEEDDECIS